MNLKNHNYQRSHFIILIKKTLTLFLFFAFLGIASGQTISKDKTKASKSKDSVTKSKISSIKTEKVATISDTIKKINPLFDQQEFVQDSLFLGTRKYNLYKKNAHASYYADKFHQKKTASGKKYDKNKYSAAHKKLPFGTIIKVTNEANGKSVHVEVTDRGPFVRSRDIDLSRKAFFEIANNKSSGKMNVTLEVLQK